MQPCYLYTHPRRKIGHAIVTRSEQPTRRWQLPSASRLQLARGSSTAHGVVMSPHSLHTGRPPCWEFVLAPFAPRARKLGCALVCNEFWLGRNTRSQFFGTCIWVVCVSLGWPLVVMSSSSGYQKWFPFWSHLVAHWVVMGSCFWYRKWFPFWGHVLVLLARIISFQITMDEGTSCGSNFGYHFWFQFWVPLLVPCLGTICACVVFFFASFCDFGHVAAHSSSPPTRAAMADKQPTHRAVPKSVASHSAAHWVVMSSFSGYQMFPTLVQLGCALCCNLSLFWVPIKTVIRFGYNG